MAADVIELCAVCELLKHLLISLKACVVLCSHGNQFPSDVFDAWVDVRHCKLNLNTAANFVFAMAANEIVYDTESHIYHPETSWCPKPHVSTRTIVA